MRRVLFDENMPRLLRRDLPEFDVRTVQEEHWSGLKNGALLRAAQDGFEVFVTVDKRLQHQQNLASFRIAVVVVSGEARALSTCAMSCRNSGRRSQKRSRATSSSWPRANTASFC